VTGQTLVQRSAGGRSVSLTDAGRLLLTHAEAITARIAAAKADLDTLAVGKAGTLKIGASQTAGTRILPDALTLLLAREPGISIDLQESNADLELLEQLERGAIDLTFAVLPLPDGPFEWAELHVEPFTASVSAHSPLAGRGEVSLEQLCRLPLVCFRSCRVTQIALDHLGRRVSSRTSSSARTSTKRSTEQSRRVWPTPSCRASARTSATDGPGSSASSRR
jgi:DNA-binding transcriptional LysR family regulator